MRALWSDAAGSCPVLHPCAPCVLWGGVSEAAEWGMPAGSRGETKEGKFKGRLAGVLNVGITEDTMPTRAGYRGAKEA